MTPNRSSKFDHSNSVHKDQEEEEERESGNTVVAIPDAQTLSLERGNMSQTVEEERTDVLRLSQTKNNTTRNNTASLVALVGCKVQENTVLLRR